ncbi:MAG: hypothetical protein ACM3VV_04255 [Deltaproteobacteria bacterium]
MFKTIRIREETHEAIDNFGKRGETFDDILRRLLQIARSKQRIKKEEEEEI